MARMTERIWRGLGAAAIVALASGQAPVSAQTGSPTNAERGDNLAEVIITTRKRQENVQDVPISMSVLGGDEIAARGSLRIRQLSESVPNVNFTGAQNSSVPIFSIRGITSQTRLSPGFESSAGVYVDGVVIGRLTGFSQELYDVDRVEFLRGPQGTLFGRNSIAGAINVVTRTPQATPLLDTSLEIGDFQTRDLRLYGTSALGSDRVLGSLALTWRENDGYQKNVLTGNPSDSEDLRAARAKLLVRASDSIDITFSADTLRDRGYGQNATGLSGYAAAADRQQVSRDIESKAWRDIRGGSITVDAEAGGLGEVTFIGAYRKMENLRTSDTDGGPTPVAGTTQDVASDQWSGELRLASAPGALQYVVGAFWFDQKASNITDSCALSALPAALRGCGTTFSEVSTRSTALFANFDYSPSDQLKLSAGVRWTDERKGLRASQTAIAVNPIAIAPETDRIDSSDVSPTIGVSYKLRDEAMLYATAARGFRSGGWNTEIITGNPRTFAGREFSDESMWNYEMGLKSQAWNNRLTLNAAVFQMNYSDMQVARLEPFILNGVPVPGALVSAITNAGKSRVRGGEFEFRLRATESLLLSGGVGYADAEYTSYADRTAAGAVLNFKGNKLDNAPKTTYNLSAAYEQPISAKLKFSARLDWNSRSDYYRLGGRANNPATDLLQGYDLLNGRIGVAATDGRWEVFLVGENIADSDFTLSSLGSGLPPFTPTGQSAVLSRPLYVGLRAAMRFE